MELISFNYYETVGYLPSVPKYTTNAPEGRQPWKWISLLRGRTEASFLNISSHLMSNRWPTLELNSLHCLLISWDHFRSISLIRVVPNL